MLHVVEMSHRFTCVNFPHARGKVARAIRRDLADKTGKLSVLCSVCEDFVLLAFQNKFLTL